MDGVESLIDSKEGQIYFLWINVGQHWSSTQAVMFLESRETVQSKLFVTLENFREAVELG